MYRRQQGIALVMAIMIVALAAITATAITVANQRQTIRTNNLILRDQAFNFAVSAENFAIRILNEDSADNNYDHLEEIWYNEGQPQLLPIDFANIQNSDRFYLEGQIIDLESRLNINTILTFPQNTQTNNQNNNEQSNRSNTLNNLLDKLAIETTIDKNVLRDSLNDWLDNNNESISSNGAEQYYYLGLEQPYQIANSDITHLSMLNQIRGFEQLKPNEMRLLRNELHSLTSANKLNINTVSDNTLDSIGLNESTISTIIENRPYENVNDFIKDANQQSGINFTANDFSVESSHFLLDVTAVMDQARLRITSIIQRNTSTNKAKVIQRIIGDY